MNSIRVSFADAKICTERLAELKLCLEENGFCMHWTEAPRIPGHWIVADEPCLERDLPTDAA